jgi:hypothetical protein
MQEALGLRCHSLSPPPCWPMAGRCFWSRRAPHGQPIQTGDTRRRNPLIGMSYRIGVGKHGRTLAGTFSVGNTLSYRARASSISLAFSRCGSCFGNLTTSPILISKRVGAFHAWRLGTYVPATHL